MRSLRPHGSGVLQKRKHQKPNSENGLHIHFAVLPIAKDSLAFGNKNDLNENILLQYFRSVNMLKFM